MEMAKSVLGIQLKMEVICSELKVRNDVEKELAVNENNRQSLLAVSIVVTSL